LLYYTQGAAHISKDLIKKNLFVGEKYLPWGAASSRQKPEEGGR
jgi:hypothetical protein